MIAAADGRLEAANEDTPCRGPLPPKTALDLMAAGRAGPEIEVDLGGGRIARADGSQGLAGLEQRVRGHLMLAALAADPGAGALADRPRPVALRPGVKEMLDAARAAD